MMHTAHPVEHGIDHAKPSGFAHELLRDWRRWSKAERIAATFVLTGLIAGIATLVGTVLRQSV